MILHARVYASDVNLSAASLAFFNSACCFLSASMPALTSIRSAPDLQAVPCNFRRRFSSCGDIDTSLHAVLCRNQLQISRECLPFRPRMPFLVKMVAGVEVELWSGGACGMVCISVHSSSSFSEPVRCCSVSNEALSVLSNVSSNVELGVSSTRMGKVGLWYFSRGRLSFANILGP